MQIHEIIARVSEKWYNFLSLMEQKNNNRIDGTKKDVGVDDMDGKIQRVTTTVVDKVLDLYKDKIDRIILYGSYARGDFTSESDVDIMILLNCSEEEVRNYRNEICRIASRISLDSDVEVSIMLNDKASFYDKMELLNFYQNVQQEGVVLYGED